MLKYLPNQFQIISNSAPTHIVADFAGRRGGKTISKAEKIVEWLDRGKTSCCKELPRTIGNITVCPKCGREIKSQSDLLSVEMLMVAPTYADLNDVNIQLLRKMIPIKMWDRCWNEQRKTLTIPFKYDNKGIPYEWNILYCRSADKPEKIGRGKDYDVVWLDEVRFYKGLRLMYESLMPTLKARNGFLYVTTTTNGKDEAYKVFYEPAGHIYRPQLPLSEAKQEPVYENNASGDQDITLITWRTIDNPANNITVQQVMKDKESMIPWYWRQEYFATVEGGIGLVYSSFNYNTHVIEPKMFDRDDPLFIGIDVGWNHPTAVVFLIRDSEDRYCVVDEIYAREKTPAQIAQMIKDKTKGLSRYCAQGTEFETKFMVIDPASRQSRMESEGRSIFDQLTECGLSMELANNDVMGGLALVTEFLNTEIEGAKKLQIFSTCENVINEFGMYRWAVDTQGNKKDMVDKINDDAMDALRYILYTRPEGYEKPERNKLGYKIPEYEGEEEVSFEESVWRET